VEQEKLDAISKELHEMGVNPHDAELVKDFFARAMERDAEYDKGNE